jgi:hypothetical protein
MDNETKQLRRKNEQFIKTHLQKTSISKQLRKNLMQNDDLNDSLRVISPNVAVLLTDRIARAFDTERLGDISQVHVFTGNQSQTQEWQWRSPKHTRYDRFDLKVHQIGKVRVYEGKKQTTVTVTLINKYHGNRTAKFTFKTLNVK